MLSEGDYQINALAFSDETEENHYYHGHLKGSNQPLSCRMVPNSDMTASWMAECMDYQDLRSPAVIRSLGYSRTVYENREYLLLFSEPVNFNLEKDIADRRKASQPYELDEILRILQQCLEGIAAICQTPQVSKGHGNLTPSSVFKTMEGTYKLGNFNTALANHRNPRGQYATYIHPSVLSGKLVYPWQTDLFDLGVLLLHLCELKEPEGLNDKKIFTTILTYRNRFKRTEAKYRNEKLATLFIELMNMSYQQNCFPMIEKFQKLVAEVISIEDSRREDGSASQHPRANAAGSFQSQPSRPPQPPQQVDSSWGSQGAYPPQSGYQESWQESGQIHTQPQTSANPPLQGGTDPAQPTVTHGSIQRPPAQDPYSRLLKTVHSSENLPAPSQLSPASKPGFQPFPSNPAPQPFAPVIVPQPAQPPSLAVPNSIGRQPPPDSRAPVDSYSRGKLVQHSHSGEYNQMYGNPAVSQSAPYQPNPLSKSSGGRPDEPQGFAPHPSGMSSVSGSHPGSEESKNESRLSSQLLQLTVSVRTNFNCDLCLLKSADNYCSSCPNQSHICQSCLPKHLSTGLHTISPIAQATKEPHPQSYPTSSDNQLLFYLNEVQASLKQEHDNLHSTIVSIYNERVERLQQAFTALESMLESKYQKLSLEIEDIQIALIKLKNKREVQLPGVLRTLIKAAVHIPVATVSLINPMYEAARRIPEYFYPEPEENLLEVCFAQYVPGDQCECQGCKNLGVMVGAGKTDNQGKEGLSWAKS